MPTFRPRLSGVPSGVIFLLFLLAACGGNSSPITPAAFEVTSTLGSPRAPAAGHVFVLDTQHAQVLRFPIRSGIMQPQPDSTLSVPTFSYGLAVGTDGSQYVADAYLAQLAVYAPGAHGNDQPIRVTKLPYQPSQIAVDANGYAFAVLVHPVPPPETAVIDPSGRLVKRFVDPGGAFTLAFDPLGNLYVESTDGNYHPVIDVYATPETNPTLVRSPCLKRLEPGLGGIAVSTRNKLFIGGLHGIGYVDDTVTQCPLPKFREIRTELPTLETPILAVADQHIFALQGASIRLSVLELDVDTLHRQVPLADVALPGYSTAIAIGP